MLFRRGTIGMPLRGHSIANCSTGFVMPSTPSSPPPFPQLARGLAGAGSARSRCLSACSIYSVSRASRCWTALGAAGALLTGKNTARRHTGDGGGGSPVIIYWFFFVKSYPLWRGPPCARLLSYLSAGYVLPVQPGATVHQLRKRESAGPVQPKGNPSPFFSNFGIVAC
jgi:hypothetical protein